MIYLLKKLLKNHLKCVLSIIIILKCFDTYHFNYNSLINYLINNLFYYSRVMEYVEIILKMYNIYIKYSKKYQRFCIIYL